MKNNCTSMGHIGNFDRKAQAALALAVSLWIANGGVASADGRLYIDADNHQQVTIYNSDLPTGYENNVSPAVGQTAGDKTLTVTGDWSLTTLHDTLTFYGGYSSPQNSSQQNVEGYTLVLDHAVVGSAYGGYADKGNAINNTVYMTDSTAGNVLGGYGKAGPYDRVTGNTLNLSGANIVRGYMAEISEFETINIKNATWGTPVLTFSDSRGYYCSGITENKGGGYATINTDGIVFSGVDALSAGQTTVLIKNIKYNGTPGYLSDKIKSGKYKIGTTLEGTGKASVVDGDTYTDDLTPPYQQKDLIYTIDTGAGMTVREQTHNTVMGASVSMTALSMGNEFVGAATEGLAAPANVGADGVSSFAQMGGGSMRQETGSHVDTHTWNAILALGHQNKKERGTMEYGAFFEYGTGNYTTHADNGLRGDGSTYYTGGGLLAKWQKKDGIYVEGSLRAGNVHDDAKNVLRDAMGNPYSYETDAPYWGVHVGVGKVIQLNESSELDVYGKFFHNHRNSVSFDAGGHYDLDAVNSDVLRLGTRYVMKREKWNFYGGLAYEQEFSGKAEGTADGMAIRGADTSGGSLRAELGAVLNPKKDGPITLDFNLSGFAGKKRGLTGGVAVTFNF